MPITFAPQANPQNDYSFLIEMIMSQLYKYLTPQTTQYEDEGIFDSSGNKLGGGGTRYETTGPNLEMVAALMEILGKGQGMKAGQFGINALESAGEMYRSSEDPAQKYAWLSMMLGKPSVSPFMTEEERYRSDKSISLAEKQLASQEATIGRQRQAEMWSLKTKSDQIKRQMEKLRREWDMIPNSNDDMTLTTRNKIKEDYERLQDELEQIEGFMAINSGYSGQGNVGPAPTQWF